MAAAHFGASEALRRATDRRGYQIAQKSRLAIGDRSAESPVIIAFSKSARGRSIRAIHQRFIATFKPPFKAPCR
jgi:hypothetical protein